MSGVKFFESKDGPYLLEIEAKRPDFATLGGGCTRISAALPKDTLRHFCLLVHANSTCV